MPDDEIILSKINAQEDTQFVRVDLAVSISLSLGKFFFINVVSVLSELQTNLFVMDAAGEVFLVANKRTKFSDQHASNGDIAKYSTENKLLANMFAQKAFHLFEIHIISFKSLRLIIIDVHFLRIFRQ